MPDISRFLLVIVAVVGFAWLMRAGWAGAIQRFEQQVQQRALSGWRYEIGYWLTRVLGPIGTFLLYLAGITDVPTPSPQPAVVSDPFNAPTDPGERTMPPASDLCLVVVSSKAAKGPASGQRFPLADGMNVIGRDPAPEARTALISIKGDGSISGSHLYIELQPDGRCQVIDRGSRYGTRLNDQPLELGQVHPFEVDDVLHLGNTQLVLSGAKTSAAQKTFLKAPRQFQFTVTKGASLGQSYTIGAKPFCIGRNGQCQWRLADNKISRQHAEVRPEGDQVRIKDLNSSHGLQVNGHPYESRVLEPGDVIRLGDTEIKFEQA